MVKKATKIKEGVKSIRKGPSLRSSAPQRATEVVGAGSAVEQSFGAEVVDQQKQLFSSKEQALEFFVGSVLDKLGGESEERAQVHEFLELLLETDPALKDDLLAGVAIRS